MNNFGIMFGGVLILISAFLDWLSDYSNPTVNDEMKQFISGCYIASCLVSIFFMIQ